MSENIYKGKGFFFRENGKTYMPRCTKCGKENWTPAINKGKCAWCGHSENHCEFYTGNKTGNCIKTSAMCKECNKP